MEYITEDSSDRSQVGGSGGGADPMGIKITWTIEFDSAEGRCPRPRPCPKSGG